MTRGKNLMVALAVAGTVVLGIGASSTPDPSTRIASSAVAG